MDRRRLERASERLLTFILKSEWRMVSKITKKNNKRMLFEKRTESSLKYLPELIRYFNEEFEAFNMRLKQCPENDPMGLTIDKRPGIFLVLSKKQIKDSDWIPLEYYYVYETSSSLLSGHQETVYDCFVSKHSKIVYKKKNKYSDDIKSRVKVYSY